MKIILSILAVFIGFNLEAMQMPEAKNQSRVLSRIGKMGIEHSV